MIMFFMFLLSFISVSMAEDDSKKIDAFRFIKENKTIYVDKSRVVMDNDTGTSEQLNNLILNYSNSTGTLKGKIDKEYRPNYFDGDIFIYNHETLEYSGVDKGCNYLDALRCGIENGHWTLKTHVFVGKKYSTLNLFLYDEKGIVISRTSKTIDGTTRVKPQWKLTTVSQKTHIGNSKTQIFEQYPPIIEELPPLIRPYHISQSIIRLYLSLDLKKK